MSHCAYKSGQIPRYPKCNATSKILDPHYPRDDWNPVLPGGVQYIRGQPELGESGYRHWQLVAYFPKKVTLSACKSKFAVTAHAEPCRSAAAKQYVWKEETRDGEQFEFGTPSVERSSVCDWEGILTKAKSGDLEGIPADVVIRYYSSLARIGADFAAPTALGTNVYRLLRDQQALENLEKLGKKLDWMHSLRIHVPSSGLGTRSEKCCPR